MRFTHKLYLAPMRPAAVASACPGLARLRRPRAIARAARPGLESYRCAWIALTRVPSPITPNRPLELPKPLRLVLTMQRHDFG